MKNKTVETKNTGWWRFEFNVADDHAYSSIVESSSDEPIEDSIEFIIRDKNNNIVFRFNPRSSLSRIGITFPSKVDGVIQTKVVEHNISLESYQNFDMKFCSNEISFELGELKLETDLGDALSDLSDMSITYTNNVVLSVSRRSCSKGFPLHPLALIAIVFACLIVFVAVFVGAILGIIKLSQWWKERKSNKSKKPRSIWKKTTK